MLDKLGILPPLPVNSSESSLNYLNTLKLRREEMFREKIRSDIKNRISKLSFEENMKIVFTPHIIMYTSWYYIDVVKTLCINNKISLTKKLVRALTDIRRDYDIELRKDLPQDAIDRLSDKSREWRLLCETDFQILYFTVRNDLLKEYKSQTYLDCMIYALISLRFLDLYTSYNKEMDIILKEKVGEMNPSPTNRYVEALRILLKGFLPENFNINILSKQVDTSMKIFRNNLNLVKYE